MLAGNNFDLPSSPLSIKLHCHQSYTPLQLLPFFYINHNVEEVRQAVFSYVAMFNGTC